MVNTINNALSAQHSLVRSLSKLSPIKRLVLGVLLLSIALLSWKQVSPSTFNRAWLSSDQQGLLHFNKGDYQQASALFTDPQWRAYSQYFEGNFADAIASFEESDYPHKALAIANAYAHSGQFEKSLELYAELNSHPQLSKAAKANAELVTAALEKIKNAPPEKSTTKIIDDRQIASEDPEQDANPQENVPDQIWLEQVRQNPSSFLRQKFQSEYANDQ